MKKHEHYFETDGGSCIICRKTVIELEEEFDKKSKSKKMKKKKEIKKIPFIDYMCKVGERVRWTNIIDKQFEGVITEWKDNIATVKLDSGDEIDVLC
jgi:hypothetical protein